MGQTTVSIRMDEDIRDQFGEFCADMGMTVSTAMNIFARKVVREYRIPFEIGAEKPTKPTLDAMAEAERMRENPSPGKACDDVDAMMEDLLS